DSAGIEKAIPALAKALDDHPERVEEFLQRAYRRLVQRVNIPGFRKGKAPRVVVERHLGREAFLQEAIDLMVPGVCDAAIREQDLDAIDISDVEVAEREPLVIKARVAMRPTVELGDYRGLRLERPPVAVDEAEADQELEELRHRYAVLEPVERPAQWGDVVRAELRGTADGRPVFDEEDAQFRLQQERVVLVPGLAEKLLGLAMGVAAEFTIALPESYPRGLAGKECHCRVVVQEVKEEKLPRLNNAFAREVGEGFPSLQALRQRLQEDLRQQAEAEADARYRDTMVERLVEMAALEYPDVLVEQEIDHLMRDQASSGGQADVERYLRQIGKTGAELRDELRPPAEGRVRRSLVLSKVAEAEGISVEASEVDQEIERMAAAAGPQAEQVRRLFDTPNGRGAIERSLLTRKTLDRLVAIASGQAQEKVGVAAHAPVEREEEALAEESE
ncbi:MAG: trigger factor, partial [Dehalococcoidia bacterium]